MAYTDYLEYKIEQAFINLLADNGIIAINGDTDDAIALPQYVVKATAKQYAIRNTGIYKCEAVIKYQTQAHDTNSVAFGDGCYDLESALFQKLNRSLAFYLTNYAQTFVCYSARKVSGISNNSEFNRIYELTLELNCMPTYLNQVVRGTVNVLNGSSSAAVTGLGLTSTPADVFFTLEKPGVTDPNIGPFTFHDLTTDGFTVNFSAKAPSAGYILHYMILFT